MINIYIMPVADCADRAAAKMLELEQNCHFPFLITIFFPQRDSNICNIRGCLDEDCLDGLKVITLLDFFPNDHHYGKTKKFKFL